ncbi:hypothetical protein ABEB36_010813 [Hypothenemus hampei]|uniref:Uncharacterized protein n=1 Tax=Hypothenemus hampei TaxID=57062 RepID=A0ABD1ED54_HYPHA
MGEEMEHRLSKPRRQCIKCKAITDIQMYHPRLHDRPHTGKVFKEVLESIQRIETGAVAVHIIVTNAMNFLNVKFPSRFRYNDLRRIYIASVHEHLNLFNLIHNQEMSLIERMIPNMEEFHIYPEADWQQEEANWQQEEADCTTEQSLQEAQEFLGSGLHSRRPHKRPRRYEE